MKILHTSDWHLGKRLENCSRLYEQEQAIGEIESIVTTHDIDLIIVAGDIFDTAVPSAEAEKLFFESILKLSVHAPLVILSGNHDDPDRLSACAQLAASSNVFIIGGLSNNKFATSNGVVKAGLGYLSLQLNGEIINLALLPYPQESRIAGLMREQYDHEDSAIVDVTAEQTANSETSYSTKVSEWLNICCKGFEDGQINVLVSHLFMAGSVVSDERELGSAKILPTDIIPKTAMYTALGHIHKPYYVSKSHSIVYSGSLLAYSFDEINDKSVVVVDIDHIGVRSTTRIPLTTAKKLKQIEVPSFDAAVTALQESSDCYVSLIYCSSEPLTVSQTSQLKKHDNLTKLSFRAEMSEKVQGVKRAEKSPSELFKEFYRYKFNMDAPSEMIDMFLSISEGE